MLLSKILRLLNEQGFSAPVNAAKLIDLSNIIQETAVEGYFVFEDSSVTGAEAFTNEVCDLILETLLLVKGDNATIKMLYERDGADFIRNVVDECEAARQALPNDDSLGDLDDHLF